MSRLRIFLFCALSFAALINTACAQGTDKFIEGEHYRVLDTPVPLHNSNKIEVAEFFAYTCSHCYSFESTAKEWKANFSDDVEFVYIPALWNGQMELLGRAFYTAKTLGVLDKVHTPLFETIHVDRTLPRNAEEFAELFAKHGVDNEKVLKTFGSFGVTSMVKQADSRARGAKLSGTPTLMVNGTYVIEVKEGKIGHKEMREIADYLVEKVRAEQ